MKSIFNKTSSKKETDKPRKIFYNRAYFKLLSTINGFQITVKSPKNYKEFDFIWSSPPCQSHSRTNYFLKSKIIRYPDLRLYEEIILLGTHFKGRWVIENTIPYYEALIKPQVISRHCFWANFLIPKIKQPKDDIGKMCGKNQKGHNKPIEERNAVNSELGLHIFQCAFKVRQEVLI